MRYCGFGISTLANNHLKDFGGKGVMDTIHRCKGHNIIPLGAGSRLDVARKPLILGDNGGGRIGIINVCEHESSIASSIDAGANPLDLTNLYYDIRSLKENTDKVIVIIHGGREHYNLPTPRMKREYHLIADFGADVIVNHHQHCFSGYELYNGKPIFYGLGNFFFDRDGKRNDKWNYGLLLKLDVENNEVNYELTPYEQCNDEAGIKLLKYNEFRQQIEELNTIIADDNRLSEELNKLVNNSKPLYPFIPLGSRILRSLYYRGLLPRFVSRKNMALMENAISCETHRDILLNYLNNNIHNE